MKGGGATYFSLEGSEAHLGSLHSSASLYEPASGLTSGFLQRLVCCEVFINCSYSAAYRFLASCCLLDEVRFDVGVSSPKLFKVFFKALNTYFLVHSRDSFIS